MPPGRQQHSGRSVFERKKLSIISLPRAVAARQAALDVAAATASSIGRAPRDILGPQTPIVVISMPDARQRRKRLEACATRWGLRSQVTFVEGVRVSPEALASANTAGIPLTVALPPHTGDGPATTTRAVVPLEWLGVMPGRSGRPTLPSEVGCCLAHVCAIRHAEALARAMGTPFAIVAEDDIDFAFVAHWPATLAELAAGAPPDWEVLHLQCHRLIDGAAFAWLNGPDSNALSASFYAIRVGAPNVRAMWATAQPSLVDLGGALGVVLAPPPYDAKAFPFGLVADHFIFAALRTYHNRSFPAVALVGDKSTIQEVDNFAPRCCAVQGRSLVTGIFCRALQRLASVPPPVAPPARAGGRRMQLVGKGARPSQPWLARATCPVLDVATAPVVVPGHLSYASALRLWRAWFFGIKCVGLQAVSPCAILKPLARAPSRK